MCESKRQNLLAMPRMLITLLFLSISIPELYATQAAEELRAARYNYQYLIEQAYLAHPAIPRGLLESQAWVATRWQHRIPGESFSHGVPPVYGLFGLYGSNEYGFIDLVSAVAVFRGVSKQELMSSEQLYVDATAAYVEDQIISNGLQGREIEAFRLIVELLSGIAPMSDAAEFAIQSHAYEVYLTVANGLSHQAILIKPQSVDLERVFSRDELKRLGAARLVFDVTNEKVEASNPQNKNAFLSNDSLKPLEQVNVDYPGAIWNASPNWDSREGTVISHVVIHTMQGSYAGSINWFLNPASEVSSHYLVRSSDGQITQMVRNRDKAWHARSANSYSLGIEHEGFVENPDWYTDVMYDESARLTAYLCNKYAIDCSRAYDGVSHIGLVELSNDFKVKGHQHYVDQVRLDPGINWDWPRYHSLVNGSVIPPPVNALPEGQFSVECTGLVCYFDATSSSDADGVIASYEWDFGDGAGANSSTITHQYRESGSYSVQITVTDDQGAVHQTGSITRVQNESSASGMVSIWLLYLLCFLLLVKSQATVFAPGLGKPHANFKGNLFGVS